MSYIFNPLPVPQYEEGMLSYLNESFYAISRAMNAGQSAFAVGTIQYTIADEAPTGWLLLDGSSVPVSAYPELASVVPSSWLVGNDIVLPNWAGRTLIGAGTGPGLTARTLGSTGGAETHTLTGAESGTSAHSHTASSNTAGSHVHNVAWGGSNPGGSNKIVEYPAGYNNSAFDDPTYMAAAGDHSHTITVNNSTAANASSAHNNMQPWAAVNVMIKA